MSNNMNKQSAKVSQLCQHNQENIRKTWNEDIPTSPKQHPKNYNY